MLIIVTEVLTCQVPFKINYQAAIRNEGAPLILKDIGLRISILSGSATGPIVYSETQIPHTDEFGIVTTVIGNGTVVSGKLSELDWSSGPYFVKIDVDPSGGTNYRISGSSQLLGVPYAFFSMTSGDGYPRTDSLKLAGIAAGAEVNVNPDWNAEYGDAKILNKPAIDGSETKILAGTNVTVTGTGIISDPYLISSAVPTPAGRIKGDIQYWDGSKWVLIPKGSYGQVLTIGTTGLPSWTDVADISKIEEKNKYIKTSYELSNYDSWLNGNSIYDNGIPITYSPLGLMQTCQLDINKDGFEDLFHFESYSLEINPTPNPPPSIFMSNGTTMDKTPWNGPEIIDPHGVKLLVGDFNNDSWPDIFSLVAVDLPIGVSSPPSDICHLLFNSPEGFKTVKEFNSLKGFWYSGCSGDIDNDNDLDIIMFNFLILTNGVKNHILWNQGNGDFTLSTEGIGDIPVVDQSELIDLNHDGFLDLVVVYISMTPRLNNLIVMWGNGSGYSNANSTLFTLDGSKFLIDIDFADINDDGMLEILASGQSGNDYFIEIYQSDDKGKSFSDKTHVYFENNFCSRFGHIRVQDIDKNGQLDIFSNDKRENIRWEQNSDMIFKRIQ